MWFSSRKTCRNAPVRSFRRTSPLRLETLENRTVPATFTVNTLADTVDANPAVTSLREAITAANGLAGDDIIKFSVTGTINLTGALPDLSSNIQVQGPGASNLTVRRDTGGDYRIFTVVGGPTVVLDGLTISNGFEPGSEYSNAYGGGIYNNGSTLTVSNSTLSSNSAHSAYPLNEAYGGGIYNNGGTLTVSNSTMSANSSYGYFGYGGGIDNNGGTLTVSNSNLSGNSANGVGGSGGGIFNEGVGGLTTVSNSTLSGNSAPVSNGSGGGISNLGGPLTVSNSTLSGNSASSGGGITNSGALTVSNSTLSGNSASFAGGGITNYGALTVSNCTLSDNSALYNGGGIANEYGFRGTLTLNNTIVANSPLGGDVANGSNLTGSHNLVEDGSGGLPDTITGDPLLGPLANNGGPTLTHALLAGSPAIDAGDNALAVDPTTGLPLTTDQRGLPHARINGARADIGAFESPGPVVIAPDPLDPSHNALFVTGTVGNDEIEIERQGSNRYKVEIKTGGHESHWTLTGSISRVVVYGGAGDDDIKVAGGIHVPAWLYGGDGNDRLKGGGEGDVLLGGAGDDLLVSGGDRDLLIGGTGADRLVGGSGDDLLIAGTTAFDSNESALFAITQEWGRTDRTYQQRYADLMTAGVGAGGAVKLNAATVFDDGAVDILTGGSGQDWFFANLFGGGVYDKITDLGAKEFATDLSFIQGP